MSASKHLILSISSIFRRILHSFFHDLSFKKLLPILIGTAIASFGLYNIHQRTGITEGGILGTILLIHHWFGLSPSIVTAAMDWHSVIWGKISLKWLCCPPSAFPASSACGSCSLRFCRTYPVIPLWRQLQELSSSESVWGW